MKKPVLIGTGIAAVALLVTTTAITLHRFTAPPTLPSAIRQQFGHTLLTPGNRSVALDRHSATYDANTHLLTFHIHTQASGDTVINEQPMPSSPSNDQSIMDNITGSMDEYRHIETALGTVHLTRPPGLNAHEVAVLATGGTLVFVYPAHDLNELQWNQFFRAMTLTNN